METKGARRADIFDSVRDCFRVAGDSNNQTGSPSSEPWGNAGGAGASRACAGALRGLFKLGGKLCYSIALSAGGAFIVGVGWVKFQRAEARRVKKRKKTMNWQ